MALGTSERIANSGSKSIVVAAAGDFCVGQARFEGQLGESRANVGYSEGPPLRQELILARDVKQRLCLSDQLVRGSPWVVRITIWGVLRLGGARSLAAAGRARTGMPI